MAQNAQTLETGEYAAFIPSLSDRDLLLTLAGVYASNTGITAQQAVTGAAAAGYHDLSERDLIQCYLTAISP